MPRTTSVVKGKHGPGVARERARIRRLVNALPDQELSAAGRYLEYLRDMGDPLLRALRNAPFDDEPTTPEEEEAVAEARAQYGGGEGRPWEEVREELGV